MMRLNNSPDVLKTSINCSEVVIFPPVVDFMPGIEKLTVFAADATLTTARTALSAFINPEGYCTAFLFKERIVESFVIYKGAWISLDYITGIGSCKRSVS